MDKFKLWTRHNIKFVSVNILFYLAIFFVSSEVIAATFYISPNGSDSNLGTSSNPWKTFKFAIPKLLPGDTLILKNGTYTKSTTGLPYVSCGSSGGAKKGTSTQRITIKAENERQAHLDSDGSDSAFKMNYCSYWIVEGLQGSSEDRDKVNGGAQASIFRVGWSSNIILRRLLAHHTNRCFNNHAIDIANSSNSLVEESEAYYFHRIAMIPYNSRNITFRRNYVNGRDYPRASNAICPSDTTTLRDIVSTGADGGQSFYGGTDIIIENGIMENMESGGVFSSGRGSNQCYGCIAIDSTNGASFNAGQIPADVYLENFIAIDSLNGIFSRGSNTTLVNATFVNNGIGVNADKHVATNNQKKVFVTNGLMIGNDRGTSITNQDDWLVEYSNSSGNSGANYNPTEGTSGNADGLGDIQFSQSTNPTLIGQGTNQCIVYVPNNSNMKGAGKNGKDIGANVIYRYENGILTGNKLWNQNTGQFPCGATVTGINYDSMESCINVNERLNVGVNGCPVP